MSNDADINAAVLALNTYRLKVEGIKTEAQQREAMAAVLEAVGLDRLREQLEKANACLRQIIEADDEFRMGLPDDWEGDPLSDAVLAAKVLLSDDLGGAK